MSSELAATVGNSALEELAQRPGWHEKGGAALPAMGRMTDAVLPSAVISLTSVIVLRWRVMPRTRPGFATLPAKSGTASKVTSTATNSQLLDKLATAWCTRPGHEMPAAGSGQSGGAAMESGRRGREKARHTKLLACTRWPSASLAAQLNSNASVVKLMQDMARVRAGTH